MGGWPIPAGDELRKSGGTTYHPSLCVLRKLVLCPFLQGGRGAEIGPSLLARCMAGLARMALAVVRATTVPVRITEPYESTYFRRGLKHAAPKKVTGFFVAPKKVTES